MDRKNEKKNTVLLNPVIQFQNERKYVWKEYAAYMIEIDFLAHRFNREGFVNMDWEGSAFDFL